MCRYGNIMKKEIKEQKEKNDLKENKDRISSFMSFDTERKSII